MFYKLHKALQKRPMRSIFITLGVLVILTVGVSNISLNTGNDTLISDQTEEYKDNDYYQEEFGGDPIILLVESPAGYNLSSINLIQDLEGELSSKDGVFAFHSPNVVFQQIGQTQKEQSIFALNTMSEGLGEISQQLSTFSSSLQIDTSMIEQVETINENLVTLKNAQEQLYTGLLSVYDGLTQSNSLLGSNIEQLNQLVIEDENLEADILAISNQLILVETSLSQLEDTEGLTTIPLQTITALDQLMVGLEEMATSQEALLAQMTEMKVQLSTLSNEFLVMSANLARIASLIESFEVGLPKTNEGLDMMLYEDNNLRPMFAGFMVDESTIRVMISTTSDLSEDDMQQILQAIDQVTGEYSEVDVLVSGKPVLDYDIKSSMMDSMQVMMIFAAVMMVVVLYLVYPVRARLLPIVVVFLAVVATVGLMGWLNIGLTMVSMAVFPVLIGLGIDYSIQMQSRYEEVYIRGEQDA